MYVSQQQVTSTVSQVPLASIQHKSATNPSFPSNPNTKEPSNHPKFIVSTVTRQFSADSILDLNAGFSHQPSIPRATLLEYKPVFTPLLATYETRPQVSNEDLEEIIDRLDLQLEAQIPQRLSLLLSKDHFRMSILSKKARRMRGKLILGSSDIQDILPINDEYAQAIFDDGVRTAGDVAEVLDVVAKLLKSGNALYRAVVSLVAAFCKHNDGDVCAKTLVDLLAHYLNGEHDAVCETLEEMNQFKACCEKVKELCEARRLNFLAFCRCVFNIWLPNEEKRMVYLSDLPVDLLKEVLSYDTSFHLIALNQTSKSFRKLIGLSNQGDKGSFWFEKECARRGNHNIGRAIHLIAYRLGARALFRKVAESEFTMGKRLWFLRYLLSYQKEEPVWRSMHVLDVVWMHLMGLFSISEAYLTQLETRRGLYWGDYDRMFRCGVMDLQKKSSTFRLPEDVLHRVTLDRMLAVTGRDLGKVERQEFKDAEEWVRNHGGQLVRGMLEMNLFVSEEFRSQYGAMK